MLTQAFLDQWKHVPIPPRLRVDDAARKKASAGETRREQVALGQAPEDRSLEAGGDPGSEEGRRAGELGDGPASITPCRAPWASPPPGRDDGS